MNNKTRKLLVLFLILFLPALIYVILSSGHHNAARLKIYGTREPVTKTVNGEEIIDTVYHTIPDFEFVNQYGEKVTNETIEGKIAVVDYFFTTCQGICLKMSSQMMVVQEKFRNDSNVIILSHTVNPKTDSVEVLADYAKQYGAIKGKWHLLTGSKKELYDMARSGYYITAMEGDGGPDDFIHSEKFVLIDKKKRIRGFYDGTDPKDVLRLVDEIKVLKAEEFMPLKHE